VEKAMSKNNYKRWKFLVKMLAKGLALGLLCCTFVLAEESLRTGWVAVSQPLSGNPWSLEDVSAEMASAGGWTEIASKLNSASYLVPSVLILLTCSLFGLCEGIRLAQIAGLRETVKCESERAIVETSRLRKRSLTDPLTRLANRRLFFEQLAKQIKRAETHGQPLSCLMLDLDFFKNVNDTFGHQFGDHVLRNIASILKTYCREIDTIARYGGEEFTVIMPNTTPEDAEVLAERLRAKVASHVFARGDASTKLTVSIGVAGWTPDRPVTSENLLHEADAALYEVKASGRNGVLTRDGGAHHGTKDVCIEYLDERRFSDLCDRLSNFSRDLKHTYLSRVDSLLSAVEFPDDYTRSHFFDVAYYALGISNQLGLSDEESEVIKTAAHLHDIGKIGMDERLLCKPGALTPKESQAMKEHPRLAAQILRPLKFLSREITLIAYHHEGYDGKGYPHGLKGDGIPLGSRIIAVADAFSAMTTERPYRRAICSEEAIRKLINNAGSQFDPDIVKAFLQAVSSGKISLPDDSVRPQTLRAALAD